MTRETKLLHSPPLGVPFRAVAPIAPALALICTALAGPASAQTAAAPPATPAATAPPAAQGAPPSPLQGASFVVYQDGKEHRFGVADLEKLDPVDAPWTSHGKLFTVHGVPLDKVLTSAGFNPGPGGPEVPKLERRGGWRKFVVVSATDGYKAVFTLAELMPAMAQTRALLVWLMDGQPIPADHGPFRVVVLTDREPTRSIYAVSRFDVIDIRQLSLPAAH